VHDEMVMCGEFMTNFAMLNNQKEFWEAIQLCKLMTIRRHHF